MECKLRKANTQFTSCRDLIETYWNVNVAPAPLRTAEQFDLIETYWNVNEADSILIIWIKLDLIETYWNVNNLNNEYIESAKSRFNRNILECKYQSRIWSKSIR